MAPHRGLPLLLASVAYFCLLPQSSANPSCPPSRRFLDTPTTVPALLWSFPGSGNTWTRLLVERASGIFTGSIYTDKALFEPLPGERRCDGTVSAIKVHTPNDVEQFYRLRADKDCDDLHRLYKCCSLWRNASASTFPPLIVLMRHPFAAFFSDFQRSFYSLHPNALKSSRAPLNPHTTTLPRAMLEEVLPIWAHDVANLAYRWRDYCKAYQKYVRLSAEPAPEGNAKRPRPVLVRYEDLKDPERRLAALREIVDALELPLQVSDEALECAFSAAEHGSIHRRAGGGDGRIAPADLFNNQTLVASLWNSIGTCAESIGYSLPSFARNTR